MSDYHVGNEAFSGVDVGGVNINFNNTSNNKDNNEQIGFGALVDMIRDGTGASLTSFTKSTMVSSKVFIQKSCAQSEVLSDLLQCTQQMYISWILAAVGLNTVIQGSRTKVKDALSLIATEEYQKPFVPTETIFKGLESFDGIRSIKMYDNNDKPNTGSFGTVLSFPKEVALPTGRIVELNLASDGQGKPYKVNVLVSLRPTFVPDDVFKQFFFLGVKTPLAQRWFQVTSGEIKFWRDFIFELNERDKRKTALKKDKTGVLREMLDRQDSNFTKWLSKIFANAYGKSSDITSANANNRQNIANSILYLSKPDFTKWCKDSGINFTLESDRNKFMFKTMSMMVAVIDDDFNRVEMYFHGIKNRGEFNFDQLKSQSKTEKFDLASIMSAMSRTTAPKF